MTKGPTDPRPHRRSRPVLRGILIALLAVALAAAAVFGVVLGLYYSGRSSLLRPGGAVSVPGSLVDSADDDGHLVRYQGKTYRYNENVVTVLFLGVDKENIQTQEGYGKNGQADTLFVAALDTATGAVRIIPLSRETMVDVNIYTAAGSYAGVEHTQLCLAYAYGADGAASCRNVAQSVSRLLYGIEINSYVAIDLQGVTALTDMLGGVEVTALETLAEGRIQEGKTITLQGELTEMYVRHRGSDVEANNRRIRRQRQFLGAFAAKAAAQLRGNFTRLEKYYNTAKPYIVSDLTFSRITYLAGCALRGNIGRTMEYITVTGETRQGETYVEFHADATSLYEAVLAAYYTETE